MNSTDHKPSRGTDRPAAISANSSLESLLVGGIALENTIAHSSNSTMDQELNNTRGPTSSDNAILQHTQQPPQLPSQSIQNGGNSAGAVTPTSTSSIAVSPGGVAHGVSTSTSNAALDTQQSTSTMAQSAIPSLLLPPAQRSSSQGTGAGTTVALSGLVTGAQAPEFLYQLTKMLTDDNKETIEWSSGKIEVHNPHKLEEKVLHKYFRHSKFASFQRQLNYFGFRKIAGKGKMSPCSYANENLPSTELSCLLHIKRKTSVSMSAKEKEKQTKKKEAKSAAEMASASTPSNVNPVLAGILQRQSGTQAPSANSHANPSGAPQAAHHAVAQAAVGRGIRHGYLHPSARPSLPHASTGTSQNTASVSSTGVKNPRSQLVSNYQSTLNDMVSAEELAESTDPTPLNQMQQQDLSDFTGGFLSRNDSLVDLAMLPIVDGTEHLDPNTSSEPKIDETGDGVEFSFIDFPNPDVFPSSFQPTLDNTAAQEQKEF